MTLNIIITFSIILCGYFLLVVPFMRKNTANGAKIHNIQPNHSDCSNNANTNTDSSPKIMNCVMTRFCNYSCKFCFHTAITSFVLPIEEAKRGLAKLKEAGMKKINFSGGEPFTVEYLGDLVTYLQK